MVLYNNNEGHTDMINPHFEDVKEFMNTFGQDVLTTPTLPSPKVGLLRYNLIEEEADELAEAMLDDDIVETADALADLLYVIYGAYAAMGLTPGTIPTNNGPWDDNTIVMPNITESIKINVSLQEDLHRLMNGYKTGEMGKIADSLDGLLTNVYRFSFECGIDIYKCFDEVHDSNMSKACKTANEATNSIQMRLNEGKNDYQGAYIENVGEYYIIKRLADGKTLKGNYYFEPNLKSILGL
ncbi:phosphoribosyl-ATP pyrophosphohydrolase-like protein [Vibrio phage 2.275.O._10N.286.54.E11]|nr:phosphoribosyl-ATP pyrophosphohydrolase-like protein [Vibrio phage 2.275.O._10N.286.54.E11]